MTYKDTNFIKHENRGEKLKIRRIFVYTRLIIYSKIIKKIINRYLSTKCCSLPIQAYIIRGIIFVTSYFMLGKYGITVGTCSALSCVTGRNQRRTDTECLNHTEIYILGLNVYDSCPNLYVSDTNPLVIGRYLGPSLDH